ncbi:MULTISPECIES: hypothetical protein [Proteus]|nr:MULTISPECIES: hypothetical protein [Proteus]MBJ2109526.1 hypothetical protein [Proteus terrae]MBJ2133470.1 hypothetical protein [Proteus terrae]MCT8231793.1 hypothetical protein [Proteus terrae]
MFSIRYSSFFDTRHTSSHSVVGYVHSALVTYFDTRHTSSHSVVGYVHSH